MFKPEERIFEQTTLEHSCCFSSFIFFLEKLTEVIRMCCKISSVVSCFILCVIQDSNMRDILRPRFLIQRGCTYDRVEYRTTILPGCPAHSNPVFTFPVALSCHCGACRTDSDECTHRASMNGARCSKPVRQVLPYLGQSNYMIPFWMS